jgi:hypothetical protein
MPQGGYVPNEKAPQSPPPALPADPGMCGGCRYASVKATHRGTAYLRCTRSAWDERLPKYPRLPVQDCPGFARDDGLARLSVPAPKLSLMAESRLSVRDRELFLAEPHIAALSVSAGPERGPLTDVVPVHPRRGAVGADRGRVAQGPPDGSRAELS